MTDGINLYQLITINPFGDVTNPSRVLYATIKQPIFFQWTDQLHFKQNRQWVAVNTLIPVEKQPGDKVVGFVIPTRGKNGQFALEFADETRIKELKHWMKVTKQAQDSYDPLPIVERVVEERIVEVSVPRPVFPWYARVMLAVITIASIVMPLVAR